VTVTSPRSRRQKAAPLPRGCSWQGSEGAHADLLLVEGKSQSNYCTVMLTIVARLSVLDGPEIAVLGSDAGEPQDMQRSPLTGALADMNLLGTQIR
jgi:hypothetical protein